MIFARQFPSAWVLAPCLLAVGGSLAVVGCRQAQSQQKQAPPPAEVTVARPVEMSINDFRQFTGETEAVESVDIRARVQGFLQEIHFTEGTEVKQGDLLYTIDPRVFQAELDRTSAEFNRLQALLALAQSEERRSARLRETNAVTEEEYVQRVATRQQAQASVLEAQAAVDLAKINLSFTDVRAPIDGRVGRTNYTIGNLVGYNEPTLLTTVVRLDPIYVLFEGTERRFLEYERRIRSEGLSSASDGKMPVYVGLEGEEGYPHEGVINFRDNRVDPGTGTIRIRATIPNTDRLAVPGMFARVRVPIGPATPKLLIPQEAVGSDQRGEFVVVVGEDNVAEQRTVTTGRQVGGLIIIQKGLAPSDRVVVSGAQKARPGAVVMPQTIEIKPPSADAIRETDASQASAAEQQQPAATSPSAANPR
jgi:multidrug efflux system membrane fusion protein